MKKYAAFAVFICVMLAGAAGPMAAGAQDATRPVYDAITIDGAITPPGAEYIDRSLNEAIARKADGLIILLDTPGGLDTAMRDIVKSILNSPIPVFVYVHPAGGRAASAGVIITVAAHVAAMTPGTNIGAAHPVGIGFGGGQDKTMMEKVENDAVAYVQGIAKKRGRNEAWVETAVRQSKSITAEEALKLNVIDYVAPDLESVMEMANGKQVETSTGKKIINTKNAVIEHKKTSLRHRILMTISDPNIAYILLLVGLAGLYFEFAHPGVILPGVIGGISLILAFFALQTLPVNYAGILLILFAIVLFIAEIKVTSYGMLSVGGVVSLILGSILLFESPDPALRVSLQVMIPTVIVISSFFLAIVWLVIKAHARLSPTGAEGVVGQVAEAVTDIHERGKVFFGGEYWDAFSDQLVEKGRKVKVLSLDGLRVKVEQIKT